MKLTKYEKLIYAGCPWLFGIVLVLSGLLIVWGEEDMLGMMLIVAGLICTALYCVCALLIRLIEK